MIVLLSAVLRNWQAAAGIAFALVLASLVAVRTMERDEARQALERERAHHRIFVAQVAAQSAIALQRFAESARRAEREQSRISQEVSSDYQDRIRELRHRVASLRLRHDAPRTHPGNARPHRVPGLPESASGVDGAASDTGFSFDERTAATEQAMRLEALQDWVRQQRAVRSAGLVE